MTIQEAWNRGNNLIATTLIAFSAFAFSPEAFMEDKMLYKVDDTLLFLLGCGAIWWYRKGKNKFKRSLIPVLFISVGFVIKLGGLLVELKEKDDMDDDHAGVILFLLAIIFVWYLYKMTPKILAKLT